MIKRLFLEKGLVGINFVKYVYKYYCVMIGLVKVLILIEKVSVGCFCILYICGCFN